MNNLGSARWEGGARGFRAAGNILLLDLGAGLHGGIQCVKIP